MFGLDAQSSSAAVAVDGHSGRPREIRVGRERIDITALEAVRDETAAYPTETGPRTVFVVRARERRYRLIHRVREDRWTVELLPLRDRGLSQAA